MINDCELLISIQRALLFNIKQSIRFIFIEVIDSYLKLWIYMDSIPTDEDYEIFYAVVGECIGDFKELSNEQNEVCLFMSLDAFENIKSLKHLVFARYE